MADKELEFVFGNGTRFSVNEGQDGPSPCMLELGIRNVFTRARKAAKGTVHPESLNLYSASDTSRYLTVESHADLGVMIRQYFKTGVIGKGMTPPLKVEAVFPAIARGRAASTANASGVTSASAPATSDGGGLSFTKVKDSAIFWTKEMKATLGGLTDAHKETLPEFFDHSKCKATESMYEGSIIQHQHWVKFRQIAGQVWSQRGLVR